MNDAVEEKKVKKGFFAKIFNRLDKKMQEKAKSAPCCCQQNKSDKKSCCN